MTIRTVNVPNLKKTKNAVIGNPTAKLALTQDESFLAALVDCLEPSTSDYSKYQDTPEELRIEASQVISSLAYGSDEALRNLLRAQSHQAFVCALHNIQPSDCSALKAAFARGLRVLAVAVAEVLGPSQWGIRPQKSEARNEAKLAMEYFFQIDILDIYLPFLTDPSTQTSISIAQLLASAVRTETHRTAVTNWLPPADRSKEVKGKRGWEKPGIHSKSPARQGGWVARTLTALLHSKESKVQEAALSALAALAKDSHDVSIMLSNPPADRDGPSQAPLSLVISLCKSRSTDVQLAACLCATRIIRANSSDHSHSPLHTSTIESPLAMTILPVVNRLIESQSQSPIVKMKACFILKYLVTDDRDLCQLAFQRGSLGKLSALVKDITPSEGASEWDEDEPENIACLREAALTAIASIAFFDSEIRRELTDHLKLLPVIHVSLSHRHVGVRYAACQCVRALGRHVGAVRTSIVDSELGSRVFRIFQREDEDRQVTHAASAAICNLVNEFSPLRAVFLEQGILTRLVQLLNSGDPALKLNAIWAIKNLVQKATPEVKRSVMSHIGWSEFATMLADPSAEIQEQAIHVLQNIADQEEGVDMIFEEIGGDVLLSAMEAALSSENEHVLRQGVWLLANLANGPTQYQNQILSHRDLLSSLRSCLIDRNLEIRKPAMSCVLQLAQSNVRSQQALRDADVHLTLQRMSDASRGVSVSPGGLGRSAHHMGVEDNSEVRDMAREALDWLEHGDDMDC